MHVNFKTILNQMASWFPNKESRNVGKEEGIGRR